MRLRPTGVPFLAPALGLLLASCGGLITTPIAKVLDNPGRYEGETVTVAGDVVESANLVVLKFYKLEDDTGRITVIAKGSVPRRGAHVKVKGRVRQAFSVGDESLTVIVEEPRD